MKNPFRSITVPETLEKQLVKARLDFLHAVELAEDWAGRAEMLDRRVKRLEGYFSPPTVPLPTSFEESK